MGKFSRFLDAAATGIAKTAQVSHRAGAKTGDFLVGSMIKETAPKLENAYLGLKPSAWGNTVLVGGAAVYGTLGTLKAMHDGQVSQGDLNYQGAPPIMAGDGIQNTSKAPTLGANGSLVFGLNAMRRG